MRITKDKTKESKNNMNGLEIFQSEEFGQVRTISIDGEPWFDGKEWQYPLNTVTTKSN